MARALGFEKGTAGPARPKQDRAHAVPDYVRADLVELALDDGERAVQRFLWDYMSL